MPNPGGFSVDLTHPSAKLFPAAKVGFSPSFVRKAWLRYFTELEAKAIKSNAGHNKPLPAGIPIRRLLKAYWQAQQKSVSGKLRAGAGIDEAADLSAWDEPMAERMLEPMARFYLRGERQATERIERLSRKHIKRLPELSEEQEDFFAAFNPEVLAFLSSITFAFITETNSTSSDRLRSQLAHGLEAGETPYELTRRVQRIFRDPQRAHQIAMTESSRALHGGELQAAKDSGVVVAKSWLASSDACPQCLAVARKGSIPLDAAFAITQSKNPAYAKVYYPPLHPFCMCSMTEVIG